MQSIEGKVGIVTGGASGIGRTAALRFAAAGARVVLADIDVAAGEETAQAIKDAGGEAFFLRTDVCEADDARAMVRSAVATYGHLDWAINNAGVDGPFMPTADYAEDDWDHVVSVNLRGVFLAMKYEIPNMIGNGGGSIVNVASVLGLIGHPNQPAYSAAKHGVVGLTRTAALEYAASGIRINVICPGGIHTPQVERVFAEFPVLEEKITALHPVGRLGTADEVADAALWLCSGASVTTGVALPVDGGWSAG